MRSAPPKRELNGYYKRYPPLPSPSNPSVFMRAVRFVYVLVPKRGVDSPTPKPMLPPGFIHTDGHRIGQIQAA